MADEMSSAVTDRGQALQGDTSKGEGAVVGYFRQMAGKLSLEQQRRLKNLANYILRRGTFAGVQGGTDEERTINIIKADPRLLRSVGITVPPPPETKGQPAGASPFSDMTFKDMVKALVADDKTQDLQVRTPALKP